MNSPMNIHARALIAAVFLSVMPAAAQTNVESNAGVQLDFMNPGARSLALGGAFVGLADDATAAFANPAGLRFISRKEFSFEGRVWSFRTPFTSGGRLNGVPTGQGIDQSATLTSGESQQSAASASFISFVYPSSRWAVALYRQQLANFKYAAESQGPFTRLADSDARLFPYRATLDVSIARYGASGSYKIGERASVGAGVYLYDFSMSSETNRFAINRNLPALYAPPNFSAAPIQVDIQDGADRRVGVNVGITATPGSKIQLGAVYRQGAHFDFVTTDFQASGTTAVSSTFTVPDMFAAGLLIRPSDALRISVDYNHVRYSDIADNFALVFAPTPGFSAEARDFTVDDANEIHAGVEYVFLNLPRPVAVRAGTWYDPDHTIRFEPANPQAGDPYSLATFQKGRNVVHGTFGAGIIVGPIEINAAGDVSSRTTTASVSTVVRF